MKEVVGTVVVAWVVEECRWCVLWWMGLLMLFVAKFVRTCHGTEEFAGASCEEKSL